MENAKVLEKQAGMNGNGYHPEAADFSWPYRILAMKGLLNGEDSSEDIELEAKRQVGTIFDLLQAALIDGEAYWRCRMGEYDLVDRRYIDLLLFALREHTRYMCDPGLARREIDTELDEALL